MSSFRSQSTSRLSTFYKNIVIVMTMFFWSCFALGSGTLLLCAHMDAIPSPDGKATLHRAASRGNIPKGDGIRSRSDGILSRSDCLVCSPSIFTDLLNPVMVTSLPILLYSIFDTDVSKEDSLSSPALYAAGITRMYYTHARLAAWVAEAIYSAAICAYFPTFFAEGIEGTMSVSEISLGCIWTTCITIDVRSLSSLHPMRKHGSLKAK